jgi:two-component system, chemotaxis family, chemotaxis protein CheY
MGKILVVEDSTVFRNTLKNILRKFRYEVLDAPDGLRALEILEIHHKDIAVVMSDINMPNLDGIGLCKKMSEDDRFNKIPIMMITTESIPELIIEAKEYGVKAWILKPFNVEKVIRGLRRILSRNEENS